MTIAAKYPKRAFELETKNATLSGEVEYEVYVENGSIRADLVSVRVDAIDTNDGDCHKRNDICQGGPFFRRWSTSPQREGWFKLADAYVENKIDILQNFVG